MGLVIFASRLQMLRMQQAQTHGDIGDTWKGRAIDSLVGKTGTSAARFEIARRVDAFVDEELGGLHRAGFPSYRADLRRELTTSADTGRADLGGRDAGRAANLETGVAPERAGACRGAARGTGGETVRGNGRPALSTRVVDLIGSLSEEQVQERGDGVSDEIENRVEDSTLSSDVELGVEAGDGLRSQDARLGTQADALASQAKSAMNPVWVPR